MSALQSDTCALSADPSGLAGVTSLRFEIYDYPIGFSAPSGWSTDSKGVIYYQGNTPPTFTFGTWGKFMFRLTANGGISTVPSIPPSQLKNEETAVNIQSPSGLYGWAAGESTQFSKSWVEHQKANQQTIETVLGATGASKALLPAKAAATANVASLSGTTTLDGIACGIGDRVLLPNQTTQSQNGPWEVASGAWSRPSDFDQSADLLSGQTIMVTQGSTLKGLWALVSTGPFTLGTTALAFSQVGGGGGSSGSAGITPVRLVLTANDALSGLSARDGVTPTAGDRVLVIGQTTTSANGIYSAASGSWTRTADADADADFVLGVPIYVTAGTKGAGTTWALKSGTTLAGAKAYEFASVPGVRTVITSNVSLSACSASQDVTLASGDLVLLARQTTSSENAVYAWSSSGVLVKVFTLRDADDVSVSDGLWTGQKWMLANNTLNVVSAGAVVTGNGGTKVELINDGDLPVGWKSLLPARAQYATAIASGASAVVFSWNPHAEGYSTGFADLIANVTMLFADGTGQKCFREMLGTNATPTLIGESVRADTITTNTYLELHWTAPTTGTYAGCFVVTATNQHPSAATTMVVADVSGRVAAS